MSIQTYHKVALFAILVALVLAVGISQQALAQFCGYNGCYSYPHQKEPSIKDVSSEDINSNEIGITSEIIKTF